MAVETVPLQGTPSIVALMVPRFDAPPAPPEGAPFPPLDDPLFELEEPEVGLVVDWPQAIVAANVASNSQRDHMMSDSPPR